MAGEEKTLTVNDTDWSVSGNAEFLGPYNQVPSVNVYDMIPEKVEITAAKSGQTPVKKDGWFVEIEKMQYRVEESWIDVPDEPIYVCAGTNIFDFQVLPNPHNAPSWPTNRPTWTGAERVETNFSLAAQTFTEPGCHEVTATCGNTVTARVCVVKVEITDASDNPIVHKQTNSVGQRISLKAGIEPESALDGLSYQWNIPGTIISNYVVYANQTSSQVFYVESSQLTNSFIDFYWVDGAENRKVTLTVTADNFALATTADFEVQAPTLNSFTSETGTVNLSKRADIWRIESGIFGDEYGMEWTADVNAPPDFGGTFKFVQLVTVHVRWTLKNGSTESQKILPPWWMDIGDPFQDDTWTAQAGSPPVELVSQGDTPRIWLQDNDKKAEILSFDFQTYLMFEPNVSGNKVFTPVGVIHWGWTAIAERTGFFQTWELISGEHNQENPVGSSTTSFPVWIDRRIIGYPPREPDQ